MDEGYLRIASDQKFLIEKDQEEDTPGRGSSSEAFDFGKKPRGVRGQLPDAPDPEVPGRKGRL